MDIVDLNFFPTKFEANAFLYRLDLNVLYKNAGTFEDPIYKDVVSDSPVGLIIMFAGLNNKVPGGYLRCDGREVNRQTYDKLFDVIGTTYGVGNGSTTFNLPDFETDKRFPKAASNDVELAELGGLDSVELSVDEMPAHSHYIDPINIKVNTSSSFGTRNGSYLDKNIGKLTSSRQTSGIMNTAGATTHEVGSSEAHENRPPFMGVYFIIKVA